MNRQNWQTNVEVLVFEIRLIWLSVKCDINVRLPYPKDVAPE
jgi:hypothetical protein